jgi:hypothetical protein
MIGFEFKVTNNALERLVHDAIMDALPDNELEVSGFSINLKVLGLLPFRQKIKPFRSLCRLA